MTHNSSEMVTGSAHLDSTGNLIIKARFNNNFKKITINNDELTYDELILMLQRLFNGRFDAKDDVKIKYRDEDGDLVDIDNDLDLKSAIQSNRYLKLVIYLGDEYDDETSMVDDKISLSKKEFRKLTETMQSILDRLRTSESVKPENSTNSSFEPLNNDVPVSHTLNNLTLSDSKEFDPLVNKSELDLKSEKSTIQTSLGDDSIKSLNSTLTERQPATLQPSAQQFQSTQNLQSKILNQSQQFQPPTQTPPQNQPPSMIGQIPPQQQQIPPHSQNQQMPYRYGMPPPSSTSNQQQMPPISRPSTFNPNDFQSNQPPQFNASSHTPSSYPTPSSTPANTFIPPGPQMSSPPFGNAPYQSQQQIHGPPQMNPQQNLTGPPQHLPGPPQSAFGPPQSSIQTGPPPAGFSNSPNRPPPQNQPPNLQSPPQLNHNIPQLDNANRQSGPPPPTSSAQQPPLQGPPQNGMPQSNPNQPPLQGPPQFTNFPPTGPYPGQQTPKTGANPFGRNSSGSRGYIYPQPQQFN